MAVWRSNKCTGRVATGGAFMRSHQRYREHAEYEEDEEERIGRAAPMTRCPPGAPPFPGPKRTLDPTPSRARRPAQQLRRAEARGTPEGRGRSKLALFAAALLLLGLGGYWYRFEYSEGRLAHEAKGEDPQEPGQLEVPTAVEAAAAEQGGTAPPEAVVET